jgi:murein L,D-transpeptidase YafK
MSKSTGSPIPRILALACVLAALVFAAANYELRPLPASARADQILVEKSARRLTLFQGGQALKRYPIALGHAPVGAKREEGDQRTPEGNYVIDAHKPDSDFHRALHVSYPSPSDTLSAEQRGVMPGEDIMIHGLQNGRGWVGAFHRLTDWTAGCIAVTDKQIEEIYRAVPDGTPIEIRP